jgi:glycosyltransferase involved in cell wall biosynthesis
MKQLTIWLFQTGEPLHTDAGNPRPMRAMNLANALVSAGHHVVLWSSAFYHQEKRHRCHNAERIKVSSLLEVRLIPSPGYAQNIGMGRLWDHILLARNLKNLLKQEKSVPDVAFIGYPPIETAFVMGKWLAERDIPFLLDVKDLWPAIFLEAVPTPLRPFGRIILAPYFMLAKASVKRASGVSAMAESFLNRALAFGKRKKSDTDGFFPLTPSNDSVTEGELSIAKKWWAEIGVQCDEKFRVCYVGNLSSNVDLEPVKDAAIFSMKHKLPVEFIICGDGVSANIFKKMMMNLTNVRFPGRIDRAQFLALAMCCHASLIPYVNSQNFHLSLPNKTLDSLCLGLPILSPLQGEVEKLITNNSVGLRYSTDSGKSLIECIEMLMTNPSLNQQMSKDALKLYQEKFSFEMVYGGLVKHLETLCLKKRPGTLYE